MSNRDLEEVLTKLATDEARLRDAGHSTYGGSVGLAGGVPRSQGASGGPATLGTGGGRAQGGPAALVSSNGKGKPEQSQFPPEVDALVNKSVEGVRAAYDYVIHQLECLRNEVDSQINTLSAKRDAAHGAFADFINIAHVTASSIEQRKQVLSQLNTTPIIMS